MKVYVFGLGHVGLPMDVWVALSGQKVEGIDINPVIVEQVNRGTIPIEEYYNNTHIGQVVLQLVEEGLLNINTVFERNDQESSVFVISVGIAVNEDGSQNLSPLQGTLDMILPKLVAGDLLLFRTTMIPGTCEKLIAPQLKATGKSVHLAYAPETIAETQAFKELAENPVILAAIDDQSYTVAEKFIRSVTKVPIYKASNLRTAELIKVSQNISRDVDAALANELSEIAATLEVDFYELQRLANTHPRVKLLLPGPGVGGYCLPNAIRYLESALVDNQRLSGSLMGLARRINQEKPLKVAETVKKALREAGKDIEGAKVSVIGLAMKDYCADYRYSPAIDIINKLLMDGVMIRAYDPLVPSLYSFQVASIAECLKNSDCLLIAAKQAGVVIDIQMLRNLMTLPLLVVDTRNLFPVGYEDVQLYKI